MNVEVVPIDSISEDPANVRTHPDPNLEAIKGSLRRFGQQKPIVVDKDGVVRAGNGTLKAARALGWPEIQIVRSALAGVDLTAYAIADNRSGELAEWDYEGLADILRALKGEDFPIEELGWAPHELEPLLAAEWKPPDIEGGAMGSSGGIKPVMVTSAQREIFERAASRVRATAGDASIEEGRCLELICADYLAS
jgi:site-specific DNA-methyltransferase (adenine-specific)